MVATHDPLQAREARLARHCREGFLLTQLGPTYYTAVVERLRVALIEPPERPYRRPRTKTETCARRRLLALLPLYVPPHQIGSVRAPAGAPLRSIGAGSGSSGDLAATLLLVLGEAERAAGEAKVGLDDAQLSRHQLRGAYATPHCHDPRLHQLRMSVATFTGTSKTEHPHLRQEAKETERRRPARASFSFEIAVPLRALSAFTGASFTLRAVLSSPSHTVALVTMKLASIAGHVPHTALLDRLESTVSVLFDAPERRLFDLQNPEEGLWISTDKSRFPNLRHE